jgi:DNA-binding transcriptional MocR family regulator
MEADASTGKATRRPGVKQADLRPGINQADPRPGINQAEPRPGINQADPRPGIVDLDPGYLDPTLLPIGMMGDCTARALARWGAQALGYGADAGPLPLREALAARFVAAAVEGLTPRVSPADGPTLRASEADGLTQRASAANVLTTAGISATLDTLAIRLASTGRSLLTEASTYDLGRKIFEARGVPTTAVPGPVDDVDVDAFARVARQVARASGQPPALYLVPTFHNPTGRVLTADRRRELVALAERLGLFVIEDQAYAELSFGPPPPPPLWSFSADPERVIALYSFAKCLAPGLRAGWLVTGERLAAELAADPVRRSGGGPSHFTVMALTAACLDGDLDRRLETLREQLRLRRDALLGALAGELPDGYEVIVPAGGFFAWVRVPPGLDDDRLCRAARRLGVAYANGRRFGAEPGVRLCFAACGPADLRVAALRLIDAWRIRQAV